jgi:hypothetical protein
MRSGRSDVSWFLRAARVVPVIAGAALLGGMIGGFAMFAIDSALTWEPTSQSPQSRLEARADNQANVANPQPTRPVRIVGGAIPDPSAGMSAPPPAPQQHSAATPAQTPTATRWPDALSRAHQNAANAGNTPNAQQQTAPAVPVQTNDRAASADDQSSSDISRRDRYSRRHAIVGTNGFRTGGDDASASPPHRRDARSYDRLYDSYGSRRDRAYSDTRQRSYGDIRDNQNDAASRSDLSRSDTRRYGPDARYRGRSRVIDREQPEQNGRAQAFDSARPRPEPFWGGGFFRRGDQDDD